MPHWFRMMLAVCCAAAPAAVQAQQSLEYFSNDDFSVKRLEDGDGCVMSTVFTHKRDGEIYFGVVYDAREKLVAVAVTSQITTSLPDKGEVSLDVVFLDNGGVKYDSGWGSRNFTYSKEDGSYMFYTQFTGAEASSQILSDIARSSTFGLFYNDKIFQALPLKGSALPVQKLRDCAFEVAGLNRNDPFAQ